MQDMSLSPDRGVISGSDPSKSPPPAIQSRFSRSPLVAEDMSPMEKIDVGKLQRQMVQSRTSHASEVVKESLR